MCCVPKNGAQRSEEALRGGIRTVNFVRDLRITAYVFYGEFDSGSERTLAACLRHASRTGDIRSLLWVSPVAHGCVTRELHALQWGIARRKAD